MADSYINISSNIVFLAQIDNSQLESFFGKVADCFEKARKVEGRVSSDEDLKLADTLRYYMRDTLAAKVRHYTFLRISSNLFAHRTTV
jgi:sorting nexin-5/6/32